MGDYNRAMEIPSLRQLREAAGVGFNRAWRELGIDSGHLLRWERGTYVPSARYIRPLARLYGVTTDAILDAIEAQRRPDAVDSGHE